ncbi:hypothetical protein MSPP1_003006 [Malassezia sp. CBS 17886]|nr:hypothetical protein MSPP1_003006 [Malassezia sp. CBS 17886]
MADADADAAAEAAEATAIDVDRGTPSETESAEASADELLARLLQCDDRVAELLTTASSAVQTLAPAPGTETDQEAFETHSQHFLALLHEIQLTLRQAARALREAQLPPLAEPATPAARLSGEAGIAGQGHTLSAASPWSLSTLRLRATAWHHVAESLHALGEGDVALVHALSNGAEVGDAMT